MHRLSESAVIQIPQIPQGFTALELAPGSARPGSTVHTVGGKPAGSTGLFSYATGSVRQIQNSGINSYGNRIRTIETNLGSNPGNSGGPAIADTRITGYWRDAVNGYRLEARIPRSLLGTRVGLTVSNTNNPATTPIPSSTFTVSPGRFVTVSPVLQSVASGYAPHRPDRIGG